MLGKISVRALGFVPWCYENLCISLLCVTLIHLHIPKHRTIFEQAESIL